MSHRRRRRIFGGGRVFGRRRSVRISQTLSPRKISGKNNITGGGTIGDKTITVGDGKGTIVKTPSPPVKQGGRTGGGGGGNNIKNINPNTEKTLIKAGFKPETAKALTINERLKIEAINRGRGFSRLETIRRLGGGGGLFELRRGSRVLRNAGINLKDIVPEIRGGSKIIKNKVLETKDTVVKNIKDKIENEKENRRIREKLKNILRKGGFRKTEQLKESQRIFKKIFPRKNRELTREQEKLNKEVLEFNKKFTENSLSEEKFKEASKISEELNKRQTKIDEDKDLLENKKSFGKKFKRVVFEGIGGKVGSKIKNKKIAEYLEEREKQKIKNTNFFLKRAEEEFKKNPKKKNEKKVKLWKKQLNRFENNLQLLSEGRQPFQTLSAFDLALLASPAKLFKITKTPKVFFSAVQTGGKTGVKTFLVFVQKGGKVGVARGITKGGKVAKTGVAGFGGIKTLNLGTGKFELANLKSFISRELSQQNPKSLFKIITEFNLLNNLGGSKAIKIIQESTGKTGLGVGEILSVKGSKFFREGVKFPSSKAVVKKVRGIKGDVFTSLSETFEQGNIAKVFGRSVTGKGGKINFEGIIRKLTKTKSFENLSGGQKALFTKSLTDTIGSVTGFLSKAEKISLVDTALKTAISSVVVGRQVKKVNKNLKVKINQITEKINKEKESLKVAQKLEEKIKNKISQSVKEIQKAKQRRGIKFSSKEKANIETKTNQVSKLKQAQKQIIKKIQKLKSKIKKPIINNISFAKLGKIKRIRIPPRRRRKKKKILKPVIKTKGGYNVFARPLKKSKKGKRKKLIKVNVRTLSKRNAKRLGSTLVDNTLSRTFKIKNIKAKARKPLLKTKKYQKKKFRSFRIIKGVKKPLKNTFIERSKYLIDSKGEKRGLTLRRGLKRLKQKSKIPSRSKKVIHLERLKNLRKARRVLIKKRLKGRRK